MSAEGVTQFFCRNAGRLSISQAKGQGVNADVLTLWRADDKSALIFVQCSVLAGRECPVLWVPGHGISQWEKRGKNHVGICEECEWSNVELCASGHSVRNGDLFYGASEVYSGA